MRYRINFDKDVWITLGAIGAVAVLFGTLALVPTLREKRELTQQQDGARKRLAEIRGSHKQLEALRAEVAMLRDNVDRDEYFVPDQPALGDLLKSLDRSLQRPEVRDRELNTSEFRRYRDYSTIPLAVEMKAPFLSFAQTLRAIETQRRLTVVDELRLRRVSDSRRGTHSHAGHTHGPQGDEACEAGSASAVEASLVLTTFFSEGKELPR